MDDSPVNQQERVAGGLEGRLERYARALGGSPDPAAIGAGSAGGVPMAGEFARAVAMRRAGVVAKAGVGGLLAVGVVAVIVSVASRPSHVPARPMPRYGEEPTYWNLQPGVYEPGSLDAVPGLVPGSGSSDGVGTPGVAPSSWPEDLLP